VLENVLDTADIVRDGDVTPTIESPLISEVLWALCILIVPAVRAASSVFYAKEDQSLNPPKVFLVPVAFPSSHHCLARFACDYLV